MCLEETARSVSVRRAGHVGTTATEREGAREMEEEN
jgi:hypothetical protein